MPITLDSTAAAVAAAPYLIGFTPRDSLVVLFLCSDHSLQATLRIDLPDRPDLCWLRSLLNGMPHPDASAVLLIAYADEMPSQHAHVVSSWIVDAFSPAVDIADVVIVADGQFASMFSSSGDRSLLDIRDHPAVAACVAAGMSPVATREVLVAHLDPVDDDASADIADLLISTRQRHDSRDLLESEALETLCGRGALSATDVVCIARACADVYVRDPLLALLLDPGARHEGVNLSLVRTRLAYCVTHLPDPHAGAVAATLAVFAWADGDGAAGMVAAQRAQASDPENTLAPLVQEALSNGMPPETWATLTADIPMEVLRGTMRRSA